mmetsp:Transcript_49478/g.130493  ORF Transcript_49478/g.130493 Transcript_49478/m.130493 type:complete len:99 (-) Transcript_49478:2-298(-)
MACRGCLLVLGPAIPKLQRPRRLPPTPPLLLLPTAAFGALSTTTAANEEPRPNDGCRKRMEATTPMSSITTCRGDRDASDIAAGRRAAVAICNGVGLG